MVPGLLCLTCYSGSLVYFDFLDYGIGIFQRGAWACDLICLFMVVIVGVGDSWG